MRRVRLDGYNAVKQYVPRQDWRAERLRREAARRAEETRIAELLDVLETLNDARPTHTIRAASHWCCRTITPKAEYL